MTTCYLCGEETAVRCILLGGYHCYACALLQKQHERCVRAHEIVLGPVDVAALADNLVDNQRFLTDLKEAGK